VKRATLLANAGAFAAALALAAVIAPDRQSRRVVSPIAAAESGNRSRKITLPDGRPALLDSTGYAVPLRPYQRIVSTSMISDRLLFELSEPERVVAYSAGGVRGSPHAHQYAGKAVLEGLGQLEAIIALKPDLVLMSRFGGPGKVAKLRAAGIEVFDLGELHGVSSMVPIAYWIGELLGQPARAERFVQGFQRRFHGLSASLGARPRRTALYVAAIGPNLYGGTIGTSYHDVLVAAGLVDVAAGRFSDWPQYTAEQLIQLDPELVVTKEGMGNGLCLHPGLERLRACTPGRVLELPPGLIDDPGPAMLEAAELLFQKAYPNAQR
jgi:iron complex transport system substrate-binding protein